MSDTPETLSASELGKLIGRSTKHIRMHLVSQPETLPPISPAHSTPSKPRFLLSAVMAWLDAIARIKEQEKEEARRLAKQYGVAYTPPKRGFALANRDLGRRGREAMEPTQ